MILTSVTDSDPQKSFRIRIMDHPKDPHTNDCSLYFHVVLQELQVGPGLGNVIKESSTLISHMHNQK